MWGNAPPQAFGSRRLRRISFKKSKLKGKYKRKFKFQPVPYASPLGFIPPLVTVIVILVAIFLLGGGLYNILERPFFIIVTERIVQGQAVPRYLFYAPLDPNNQLGGESFFSMIYLALGTGGALVAQRSIKYMPSRRTFMMLLIIGLTMIVFGIIGLMTLLDLKMSFPPPESP